MKYVTVDYERMTMTIDLGSQRVTLLSNREVVKAGELLRGIADELDQARSTAGWFRKTADDWAKDMPESAKQVIISAMEIAASVR